MRLAGCIYAGSVAEAGVMRVWIVLQVLLLLMLMLLMLTLKLMKCWCCV